MKNLFIIISFVSLLLLSGCGSPAGIVYAFDGTDASSGQQDPEIKAEETVNFPERTEIYIAVLGEVNNPGIYVFEGATRVFEVINQAGGTRAEADLTGLDLVKVLSEDCTIIVPSEGGGRDDLTRLGIQAAAGSVVKTGLININTASREELMTLKGIGPTRADSIIEYRNTSGGFSKIEDLKNVSGIGEATFAKLKDCITVD